MEENLLPPRDLGSFLSFRAEEDGNLEFAYCRGSSITLKELDYKSELVAISISSLGIRGQERIAIVSEPSLDYLVAEFGIWKSGAVCVPINPHLKSHEFEYLKQNSGFALAFVSEEYLSEFAKSNNDGNQKVPCFIINTKSEDDVRQNHFSSLLTQGSEQQPKKVKVKPTATACILYTSGTSGAPKGVIYEHYGLLPFKNETYVQQMMDVIGLSTKDITYLPFPLYHILGQVHVIGALRNGGKIVLAERFSVSHFWQEVKRYNATVLVHQGASIPLLLKQPKTPYDKDHKVRLSVGAGTPNSKVWREFEERFGVKVFEHYAQTEGSFFGAGTMPTNRAGTIGLQYPSAEVRIVDESDIEVPEGEPGQFLSRLRTEYALKQPRDLYYNDPDKGTSRFAEGGWFRSGDIVRRDKEGYFYYAGKVETFIRYRGENISPLQIESVLSANDEIDECIAVGVPNSELGGDDIKLVIVPRKGTTINSPNLFKWCESRFPKFMLPRFIEIVPELKKSEQTKKVLRGEYTSNLPGVWDREYRA